MGTSSWLAAGILMFLSTPGGAPTDLNAGLDAPDAYVGTWAIDAMTHRLDGVPGTWLREDVGRATVRGDARIFADWNRTVMTLRWTILAANVMKRPVTVENYDLTIDRGRWILTSRTRVRHVYDAHLTSNGIVLAWALDDARNRGPTPPTMISIKKIAPWTTNTVGRWEVVDEGTCAVIEGWSTRRTTKITIGADLLFEQVTTISQFADDRCFAQITDAETVKVHTGFVEEIGNGLALWTYPDGDNLYLVTPARFAEYEIRNTGAGMVWIRRACEPVGLCESNVPRKLELASPSDERVVPLW